jgi:TonB family protein
MPKILLLIGLFLTFNFYCSAQQTSAQASGNPLEVKITSQARASYTDEARQNKVEGWVRLRVTFLATGEIGEVVYVKESSKKKKLTKRGLVAEALKAAKNIKFTPATDENGNPVTVTKEVEYSFTIY